MVYSTVYSTHKATQVQFETWCRRRSLSHKNQAKTPGSNPFIRTCVFTSFGRVIRQFLSTEMQRLLMSYCVNRRRPFDCTSSLDRERQKAFYESCDAAPTALHCSHSLDPLDPRKPTKVKPAARRMVQAVRLSGGFLARANLLAISNRL